MSNKISLQNEGNYYTQRLGQEASVSCPKAQSEEKQLRTESMPFLRRKKALNAEETTKAVDGDLPPGFEEEDHEFTVEVDGNNGRSDELDEQSDEELTPTEPPTPHGSSPQNQNEKKKRFNFMNRFKRSNNGGEKRRKGRMKQKNEKNEIGVPGDAEKIDTLDGGYAFISVRSKLDVN